MATFYALSKGRIIREMTHTTIAQARLELNQLGEYGWAIATEDSVTPLQLDAWRVIRDQTIALDVVPTSFLRKFDAFIADMREQEIHVGAGIGDQTVRCCLDGQPWPCQHEQEARRARADVPTDR